MVRRVELDGLHRRIADLAPRHAFERWELSTKSAQRREVIFSPGQPLEVLEADELGLALRCEGPAGLGFASIDGDDPKALESLATDALMAICPGERSLPPESSLAAAASAEPPAELPPGWASHHAERLGRILLHRSGGGIRLDRAVVAEGRAHWSIAREGGHCLAWWQRGIELRLDLEIGGPAGGRWSETIAVPDPEGMALEILAERVLDRAALLSLPVLAAPTGTTDLLLAAEVMAPLLAALTTAFVARESSGDPLPRLLREGRLAHPGVDLVDRRCGAIPAPAPVDGEGMPASDRRLLAGGELVGRLASWHEAAQLGIPAGSAWRASIRERPRAAAANPVLSHSETVSAAELIRRIGCGVYLLRLRRPPRLDIADDRYELLGTGLVIAKGRPVAVLPTVRIADRLSFLLQCLEAGADDLTWLRTAQGWFGCPTLLAARQEVR